MSVVESRAAQSCLYVCLWCEVHMRALTELCGIKGLWRHSLWSVPPLTLTSEKREMEKGERWDRLSGDKPAAERVLKDVCVISMSLTKLEISLHQLVTYGLGAIVLCFKAFKLVLHWCSRIFCNLLCWWWSLTFREVESSSSHRAEVTHTVFCGYCGTEKPNLLVPVRQCVSQPQCTVKPELLFPVY